MTGTTTFRPGTWAYQPSRLCECWELSWLPPPLVDGGLEGTAKGMLAHLSILFVPAGVGVMLHFQRMADEWLPILIALVASTFITIAVTALLLRALTRHRPAHADTERQP